MCEREIQELVREERRRYAREWRKKNPEKVRAANKQGTRTVGHRG